MIEVNNLHKSFGDTEVLKDISFTVNEGEILAIVGPSGAGKSTLSRCVSMLETADSGSITVNGENLAELSGDALRAARHRIGTIFQSAPLLRRRTVSQNVALPLEYYRATDAAKSKRITEVLDEVGLSERADFYPSQLSGGQQQRVGIARAIALNPNVLLSDEATSGLDPSTTRSILDLVSRLREDLSLSVILITHEMDVVRDIADSVARIEDGRIVETGKVSDIVLDPNSPLSRELLPERPFIGRDRFTDVWEITYAADDVPGTWLTTMLRNSPYKDIEILSATVEAIQDVSVGRIVIGTDEAPEAWLHEQTTPHGLGLRKLGNRSKGA